MMTYTLPDFTVLLGLNLFFVQLLERFQTPVPGQQPVTLPVLHYD